MDRRKLIVSHVVLAGLFTPFLLLMPISGTLYLLGYKGSVEQTAIDVVSDPVPEDEAQLVPFFREQLQKRNLPASFEYVRVSKTEYTLRPSTKTHYQAIKSEEGLRLVRIEPSLVKRLIELHVGHGPQLFKWVQIAFGVALLLIFLSGLYLATQVPTYRRPLLFSVGAGVVLLAISLI